MWWYTLACLALLAGLFQGWLVIRRGRRPLVVAGATCTWTERPVPIWRQDRVVAGFIVLHSGSIVMLAVLFLRDIEHFSAQSTPLMGLLGGSLILSFVCWASGVVLAFPVARRLAPPFTMQLFADAIARGQYVADWASFSSFQADAVTHTIHLYAAYAPRIVRVVWQPPTPELFEAVVEQLTQVLPSQPPSVSIPWYRGRAALLGALLLGTLPFVAGSILATQLSIPWNWLYYSLAVAAVVGIGQVLIQRFQIE